MSRISEKFDVLKKAGGKALIPYIMAGDPDMAATGRMILELEKSGADIIELGVPFSDPLADGPTIQRAAIRALKGRVNLSHVFSLVRDVRKKTQVPIVLMLYYNLVLKYGEDRFVKDAVSAGVDGVIVPDLPPEEAEGLMDAADRYGLDVIFLLAPTSSPDRIRLVAGSSRGFIYYVSLTGVTGARVALDKGIQSGVRKIRRVTGKPVCVGFGISGPEQAAMVSGWADGVIVGSAIVGIMERSMDVEAMLKKVGGFVRGIKKSMLPLNR